MFWESFAQPSTVDDDVITTVAYITILYCVLIDTTLPPAAAGICVYRRAIRSRSLYRG
jgi:hypothetical protein